MRFWGAQCSFCRTVKFSSSILLGLSAVLDTKDIPFKRYTMNSPFDNPCSVI